MNIEILPGYDHEGSIRMLFQEYTAMLVACSGEVANYLALQNYDKELANLEEKYGPPHGRLYLLTVDGKAAGCVGLRKLDETTCEMKRLYVRPAYRGQKMADLLLQRIIEDGKAIGYCAMLLDTLPFLESAIALYKKWGFRETERYNDSPVADTVFMKLELA